ncbi:hypothetical protein C8A00DRAFT_36712 [Chaetomidium leptoderma]|uniref:Uncharacterized protein n=1 Tax=Chaetomidium leptoderma TaxID=669021 RepID=A0AAN6VGK3_9PEZI|nr:hypothetical protein C8A00DRAFT_36712 [Chaetomidium leptoderma]
MCLWEELTCSCCGKVRVRKMKYSCDYYPGHAQGDCKYDDRYDRDRVVRVYPNKYCSECRELYKYVNYE